MSQITQPPPVVTAEAPLTHTYGLLVEGAQGVGFEILVPRLGFTLLVFKEIAEPNRVTVCGENENIRINLTQVLQVAGLTKHQT
jgi:hypothetical protein